jgi:broad specificity phosphatase PhoE
VRNFFFCHEHIIQLRSNSEENSGLLKGNHVDKTAKIFVLRHGQSLEDVDKTAHERMADEDMPLSEKGVYQALEAGEYLAPRLGSKSATLYLSPSTRVSQTGDLIASKLRPGIQVKLKKVEGLRKQDWGIVTPSDRPQVERERYETGVLRYNFPNGESASSFLGRLSDFVRKIRKEQSSSQSPKIIITHGFEMRIILMHMLGWDEDYFECLAHPDNCEIKELELDPSLTFRMKSEMRKTDCSKNPNFIARKK